MKARPAKTKVEKVITAQTAKYQSLPRTVMWLLVKVVLVKPFLLRASLRLDNMVAVGSKLRCRPVVMELEGCMARLL